MATRKTTKTEEVVETTTTEEVVEAKEEEIVEAKEEKVETVKKEEPVTEKQPVSKKPRIIANVSNVNIYSIPSIQTKNKIGTMIKGNEYEIIDIVDTVIYGTFYRIPEGYILKQNNFTLIN